MSNELRSRVAKEAATLLYFGTEKEYKQAKTRAAETLGTHFLPSNLEIALELDKIAEEIEGDDRKERLNQMRREALQVMKFLDRYDPVLIGSVWRGTIHLRSDIDIAVYADNPEEILGIIGSQGIKTLKTEWTTINKQGKTFSSFHVYAEMSTHHGLEIVIRNSEEKDQKRQCQIFGDQIKGLKIRELEKVIENNPTQKFIPS